MVQFTLTPPKILICTIERQPDEKREFPRAWAARSLGWASVDVLGRSPPQTKDFCIRFARKSHNATLSYFLPSLIHLVPPMGPRTWHFHTVHNSSGPLSLIVEFQSKGAERRADSIRMGEPSWSVD